MQTQLKIEHWICLLNVTGGTLKPEKCWWYLLEDGTKIPIKQEEVTASKKTLGIHNAPAGGIEGHLDHSRGKATAWVTRMTNGHLPSHTAWVAYRHQLWPGLRYGLGTIKPAAKLLDNINYRTLNVLGILRNITKGLRKIHTTFGGFWMFDLPTKQLISRVKMIFQHYHVSTKLSKKLDASLGYLQLQVGTPHNPFTQDYSKWGELAPLSWVKMLWK